MSATGPRSIGELLQSGDIARLRHEAQTRRELATKVRAELPRAEAGHVVSAHLDDQGRLVIGMDSAAWAAKLRYSLAELGGRQVRVRVAVPGGYQD
jgi:hypothetical protein